MVDGFETPISNKISTMLPKKSVAEETVYYLIVVFSFLMIACYSIINIPTKKVNFGGIYFFLF